ncbi:MAG: lipopolysaccharide biosynthesis protein [Pirellulaceae bacterium]|nr:lipopolysaccharide biosynthesis protein [Pirellulaceae bacterium]
MAPSNSTTQPKIRQQAAWVIGCRVIGIGCTLASNMLVARLLGPAGFGVFLLVVSVLALGCILAMSGLSEAGLRFVSENLGLGQTSVVRSYLETTVRWIGVTSVAATLLVSALLAIYQRYNENTEVTVFTIALVSVGVIVLAWQQFSAQLLRALNDLRAASFYSGGQTGGPLSNLLFMIPLLLIWLWLIPITTNQIIALLVISICGTLPIALWEFFRASHRVLSTTNANESLTLSEEKKTELIAVASSFLGIQLLAFVFIQCDIWIGSWLLTPEDFGLYGAAKRGQLIAQMPLQMALMTVQGSIPSLYAQGRRADLEQRYRSAITWSAIPAISSLVLFMIFPIEFLTVICGSAFGGAAPIVAPLAVGLLALLFFGSPSDILAMTGNHRIVLWVNAFSAVGLIVFGIIGAWQAGPIGLAIASSAVYVLQNVGLWTIARKRLRLWTHVGGLSWKTLGTLERENV